MKKYIVIGQDSEFTSHVIRVEQDKSHIIATLNSWRRAMSYANALNFPNAPKGGPRCVS